MTEKPKFGAGSMSEERINDERKESLNTESEIVKDNVEFGAESNLHNSSTKGSKIWMVFKSQGIYFWIISYVSSFIIYSLLDAYSTTLLNILNLFLFPFALILFSQLQIYFTGSMNGLAQWLAPNFRVNKSFSSGIVTFLWYASKLIMYYFVWNFSFIIGVLGILITLINSGKINK